MKLFKVILVLLVPLISTQVLALEEDLYHGQPKAEWYPHDLTVFDNKGFALGFDPVRKVPLPGPLIAYRAIQGNTTSKGPPISARIPG